MPRPRRTTRPRRAGATSCRRRRAFFEKSAVVLGAKVDIDVFGIDHDELAAAVQLFIVRGGRIRGVRSWMVDKELDVSLGELVDSVLQNAYGDELTPAREIVVPELPDDAEALETWLGTLAERKVRLRVAQRGDKAALLGTATQNARQSLMLYKTRRSADFTTRSRALEDIQEALGMADAPLRMECFDVSHLSGTNIVASMVVFEDGLPRKDEYRRFTIPNSTDDTDSIHQVLTRRLAYLAKPDGSGAGPTRAPTPATAQAPRSRRSASRATGPTARQRMPRRRRAPQEVRLPPEPAHRRRRPAAGRGGGTRARGVRRHGHPALRHRQAARGDLAARLRLPGDPAAQQRRAVPLPAHPRRGAPLRHHVPAAAAQARHRLACSSRSPGSARPG